MKITQLTTSATAPLWAGSVGRRDYLLSGGAKLLGSAFPLVNGAREVKSGTLVSRDSATNAKGYVPFNAAFAQHAFVWDTVTSTDTNPDVDLYTAGEVRLDRLPIALTAEQITAIKGQFVLTTGGK